VVELLILMSHPIRTQQAQVNSQSAGRKVLKRDDIEDAIAELEILEFLRVALPKGD
jgi:hypothetical protein